MINDTNPELIYWHEVDIVYFKTASFTMIAFTVTAGPMCSNGFLFSELTFSTMYNCYIANIQIHSVFLYISLSVIVTHCFNMTTLTSLS